VRPLSRLEKAIEAALGAGLLVSGTLLVFGLATGHDAVLHRGIVLLLWTPVLRVIVVAAGMLYRREWVFAAIALWILLVIGSGALLSLRAR
jgi:uncharacterized membrane protein